MHGGYISVMFIQIQSSEFTCSTGNVCLVRSICICMYEFLCMFVLMNTVLAKANIFMHHHAPPELLRSHFTLGISLICYNSSVSFYVESALHSS